MTIPHRILMTADTVGGVWCYTMTLAEELGASGTEILLATMGAPLSASQRQEVRALPHVQIAESTFKLEWMPEPWADVEAAGEWLLSLAGKFQPDVIHLNGYTHAALPWGKPVLVVAHSCVLSWWEAVHGVDAPKEWDPYRRQVKTGLMAADLVVTPSRSMLQALLAHYGGLPRAEVIPNGRRLDRFAPGHKQEVVFCAGRLWDEAKNVQTVCAAASEISWPVVLAGSCTRPDGRETELPNVNCLGHLPADEIAAWFARAAIYAHPARYEPFGLSVLEAALSGCALVLGDIPSLRENWDGAALFVSPSDPHSVRDAIRELIAAPKLRQELSIRARAGARQFSICRTAQLYQQAYASLVKAVEPDDTAVLTA